MKKLALGLGVAALALSTTAMAANVGWNAGVQGGWNKYYNTSTTGSGFSGTSSTSGLGYGLYGAYNFSKNFGLRLGANKYSKLTFKDSSNNKYDVKYYSVDLLAMGYYPLNQQFDLMGGAGVAYVHEKESGSNTGNVTENFYRPELLVGGSYNFNQNWSAFASYSYIFGKGKVKDATGSATTQGNADKYMASIAMLSLGVNYSF